LKIVLENKGIKTDTFYIPPFVLYEGEMILVNLLSYIYFQEKLKVIKDIFCGKTKHENVIVHEKILFMEHFQESFFRYNFYPTTVGEYLKKNADLNNPFARKIYEFEGVTKKTKVKNLPFKENKLLHVYAALSKSKKIAFDLMGVGAEVTEMKFKMIHDIVENGGSAILIDCYDDMKDRCTKYLEVQFLK